MVAFQVSDMSCAHCADAITHALRWTDKGARVRVDLAAGRVQVEPARAGVQELLQAIEDAGYTATWIQGVGRGAGSAVPATGCCCG